MAGGVMSEIKAALTAEECHACGHKKSLHLQGAGCVGIVAGKCDCHWLFPAGENTRYEDCVAYVTPALTPEEWAMLGVDGSPICGQGDEDREYAARKCHAVAARALYGQPFGFTWEDVDALRDGADYIRRADEGESGYYHAPGAPTAPDLAGLLREIADRIAALLPLREQ